MKTVSSKAIWYGLPFALHSKYGRIFSRFDTIHGCDRQSMYTTVAALRTSPTCCSRQVHYHVHFVCALRRLVELRQAATSNEIRRTGVFTFWSNFQSTPDNCRLSLFSSENLKQSCSHVVSRNSSHTYVMHLCS